MYVAVINGDIFLADVSESGLTRRVADYCREQMPDDEINFSIKCRDDQDVIDYYFEAAAAADPIGGEYIVRGLDFGE